jgi:hypothetical protein
VLALPLFSPIGLAQPNGDEAAPEKATQANENGDPAKAATAEEEQPQSDQQKLPVTVLAVENLVQVRAGEDDPWQRCQEDMRLGLGVAFRTGPRSAVRFAIGDNETVTLDRLGVIKVVDAIRQQDGKIETDLGMEYGRSELEVEGGGVEHESRIRSPGATLAVRGSEGGISDNAGYPVTAYCRDTASFFAAHGQARFQRLAETDHMTGKDRNPADRRYTEGTFNPTQLANTTEEREIISAFPSGIYRHDQLRLNSFRAHHVAQQQQASFQSGPFEDVGASGDLRGQLVWRNSADLDLYLSPPGETPTVYFANQTQDFRSETRTATAELDENNSGNTIDVAPDKRVENLVVNAESGDLPHGTYEFFVRNFLASDNPPDAGTLTVGSDAFTEQIEFELPVEGSSRSILVTMPGDNVEVEMK